MPIFQPAIVVLCVLVLSSCKETETAPATAGNKLSTHAADTHQPKSTVSKLTFVGQKEACSCTRERIEKSWAALTSIVAQLQNKPQIERIQLDVDKTRADELGALASVMVAPGLYLFDDNGSLIELLQGELSPEQLRKALH